MKVGEIYSFVTPSGWGDNSRRHPFVVLNIDGDSIECCMITHSPTSVYSLNKPLQAEFFQKELSAFDITPFQFDANNPSYFLSVVLLKPSDYFDFKIARLSGKLTPAGLAFIKASKRDMQPMSWQEYRAWARG